MNSSQTTILLDNLLERLEYYRTDEAITFYAPYKFELKQRIKKLEKDISKLRTFIAKNPNENIDTTELQSLYSLMSKESYSQEFIEKSKNVISNSTINAGRDIHIGDVHITKTTGFSILFVIAFITVIGLWQKEEIKIALGFDKFFVEEDLDFKIIILPFKQLCDNNGQNYDAGFVIKERLNGIIQKESLKVKTVYWENFDQKGFNDQKADELRKYHHADMILYGTYQTESCSAEGDQICLNYLTDEKWKLEKTGYNLDKENYKIGGLDALKKGKIQEKVENIAVFVSVLAQMKNIDHSKYLAKLREVLEEISADQSTQAYVYEEIAWLLLDDGQVEDAITNYKKASIGFKKNKKIIQYIETLGKIGACFLYKKQSDSANFYHNEGKEWTYEFLQFCFKDKIEFDLQEQLYNYASNIKCISNIIKEKYSIKAANIRLDAMQDNGARFDSDSIKLEKFIEIKITYYFMAKEPETEKYYEEISILIYAFLCEKFQKQEYCDNADNQEYF